MRQLAKNLEYAKQFDSDKKSICLILLHQDIRSVSKRYHIRNLNEFNDDIFIFFMQPQKKLVKIF